MLALAAAAVAAVVTGDLYWTRGGFDVIAAVRLDVRLAETNPAADLRPAVVAGSGERIYLHPETVVNNSDIVRAEVIPGSTPSTFGVSVTLTRDGAARMFQATQSHLGRPLAILIDGQVVAAPVVRGAIGASGIISGAFTRAEADRIAAGIIGR